MQRLVVLVVLPLVLLLAACDRSSGGRGSGAAAQGPAGPMGPAGPAGPRGLAGRDAAESSLPRGLFDVTDYGALGDGTTDDAAAIQSAVSAAHDVGGGVIWFPQGDYAVSRAVEIGGMNNMTFRGAGVDATVIHSTSATAPVFNSSSDSRWRVWEDMTLTSSVTKTSGAMIHLAAERRSTIRNVKITRFFNGIAFDAFEVVSLESIHVTNPSGPGTGLVVGRRANAAQGANLTLRDSFFRGQGGQDGVGGSAVGLYGIDIFDADAVFMINTDFSGYVRSGMRIEPNTRSANHHFLQNYFDATISGPCVDVGGAGLKSAITFTGNWFASAGKADGQNLGNPGVSVGLRLRNEGTYGTWNITGGRVIFTLGRGIEVLARAIELAINGVQFELIGGDAIFVDTALNAPSPHVSGVTIVDAFSGNDIVTSASSNRFTISATRGNGRFVCGTRPALNAGNIFFGGSLGCS